MDMAAEQRPSTTSDQPPASTLAPPPDSDRPQSPPDATPVRPDAVRPQPDPARPRPGEVPRLGLLARLSSQFGSRGLTRRGPLLGDAARRVLLLHGLEGTATVLSVRADAETGPEFWVRVQLEDRHAYETRVRQRASTADREWMQPGDIVCCRVDPGDHDRVVLYLPAPEETSRTNIAKILADGRRARATVLATTPVAADYTGRDDPVLRLDLELRAWDEPSPWRVRVVQPVPLSALELVDLGRRLDVAFFTVDRGESVAVDWAASRRDD
ncbi:hypothetical protein [Nocardia tengchongensis]|uniref:hypothetical protein n=1 Tax=Nocardia tengchongensis TaxID=2055889 RepID=UPI001FEAC29B|nr:hypothetical protein [Nocardia tengchongensis]